MVAMTDSGDSSAGIMMVVAITMVEWNSDNSGVQQRRWRQQNGGADNGGGNGGVVVVDVAKTRCNNNDVGDGMVDGMVVMVEAK